MTMKKFYTIIAALLMGISGMKADVTMPTLTTDPNNPVLYAIQSFRSYRFEQYVSDDAAITPTFDFSSASAKFYFVAVNGSNFDEGVKIVSSVNGKQLVDVGTGFADTGTTWYIKENPYNEGFVCISKTSNLSSGCWDCNANGVMTTGYWRPASGDAEGTSWSIVEAPQYQTSTLDNPKWYYLKTGRGRYVYADGTNVGTNTSNPKTEAYKFAFISVGGTGVNIVSKVGLANGSNQYLTTTPALSSTPSTWYYFGAARYAGYFLLSDDASGYGYPHLLNDNGNGGLAKWHVEGTGSYFQVEEVIPVCDVTYTYTFNGNTYSATETQNIGAAVSLPASINFPYTNYSFNTGVVPDASTATVNVTVNGFDMPFETSTDYANAKWYFLRGHASTGNYPSHYISTDGSSLKWADGNGRNDHYQWAFIGNPIDGIKVINKASGNGYYLTDTETTTSMTATATEWVLKEKDATHFGLWSTTRNNYANCAGGTIKYWWDFDNGSLFWVETVPDNYASYVEAEIKPWFDNYGSYFQLKTSVVEANQSKYEDALVNCDLATYEELLALIAEANNYVFPETGYYRIKSSGARIGESYIAYGQPSSASAGLITVTAANAATDASTILRLTGSNGQYTISTQGLYAQNQTTNNVAFPMTDNASNAATFSFIPHTPGVAVITNDGTVQGYFHEAGWAVPGVVRWTAEAGASQWTIEEAEELTVALNAIGADYYATLCVPFAYTVSGATAYTLTNASESALTMNAVTGTVAAGTPVMLVGSNASATLTIGSGYAATPVTETALTGQYLAGNVSATSNYFLGRKKNSEDVYEPGFYMYSGETLALGANRAYYHASASSNGFKLVFADDDVTAVASAVNGEAVANGQYFDLQGRKVQNPVKGQIYILNGKKVLF